MCGCRRLIRVHESIVCGQLFELSGPHEVTPDEFERAAAYTVFCGPAVDTGIGDGWDLFGVDGATADWDVLDRAAQMGIVVVFDEFGYLQQPQWDQDTVDPHSSNADDLHAACAYLNSGGRLVKLPDAPDSPYYRLYAIADVRRGHHVE